MNTCEKNSQECLSAKSVLASSLIFSGIALFAFMPCAWSQNNDNDNDNEQFFGAIEEVIVHARKRAENIQDVPQSVTAMHHIDIENAISRDIRDLEGISPNLIIDRVSSAPGGAAISMRGISFQDLEKSFDPSVGVVLDGVFLGTNTGQEMRTIDLERVEVLRGPQGTVFGKNSIGGIINLVRSDPTGEPGVKMRARAGEFETHDLETVINLPMIQDVLATKFVFATQRQGKGFSENVSSAESRAPKNNPFPEYTADGKDATEVDYESYLIDFLYTPSAELSIEWVYQREKDYSDTGVVLNYSSSTDLICGFKPLACPPGTASKGSTGDKYKFDQNFNDFQFIHLNAHTLQVDYDLSDDVALTYIFGRRSSREQTNQDFDASSENFFSTVRKQSYFQQSHELRFDGSINDRLDFVIGGYLIDAGFKLDQMTLYLLQELIIFTLPPADWPTSPRAFQQSNTDHDSEATAIFFEADYAFNDELYMTLGGRYTEEEKSMGRSGSIEDPQDDGSINSLETLNLMNDPTTDKWSEFSPKIGFKYDKDELLYYGYLSSGFRSGGMNGRANSEYTASSTFDPETVNNLELGIKSSWLDSRLRINAAIFFQRYKDKQEELVIPALTGQETITINAAEANLDGLELELVAIPTPNWQLFFNLGLLDTEYDKFKQDTTGDGIEEDFTRIANGSKRELRRAPDYTWSIRSTYNLPIGPGVSVFQINYRYKDDFRTTFNNIEPGLVEGHGILDAAIFYRMNNWSVSVFGKNITDEDEVSAALDVAGLFTFVAMRPPRIFGVEATYEWGGLD